MLMQDIALFDIHGQLFSYLFDQASSVEVYEHFSVGSSSDLVGEWILDGIIYIYCGYTVEPGYNESYGTRENIPYNQVS